MCGLQFTKDATTIYLPLAPFVYFNVIPVICTQPKAVQHMPIGHIVATILDVSSKLSTEGVN